MAFFSDSRSDAPACTLPRALLDDLKAYIDRNYLGEVPPPPTFRKTMGNARRRDAAVCEDADAFLPDAACAARPPLPVHAAKAPAQFEAAPARAESLDDFLKRKETGFSEHLLSLLNECGEKDSAVYRRAEISRQLFHKILSKKDYQPTKSTAIQLALGLRLDLPAAQTLLKKAGYALTRSSKTDLVVQYFIERGEYSIVTINTALYDCGLPLLKTGSAL